MSHSLQYIALCSQLCHIIPTEEFREAVKVGLKLGRLKLSIADTEVCTHMVQLSCMEVHVHSTLALRK